ncbi:pirin family protein [Stackebrandtia nassauensis]|uniref:Pirin domain protein n=1 Tax=Stackebrandtia nassauensis (strain DSM 44728 / CIP 108903 / NRRL B-16338 / NBRC 102104 / LLR-40K-21) TaxID=446470 RepID=D3Q3Y3_STANL|nr:pirin family protein [Stackebrandtia nassauensis]ADD44050.1 Pirin domain protein [Stackebrandtia nassauensis DSM 44728]
MPAVTVSDILVLPRVTTAADAAQRPVSRVTDSIRTLEGAGFPVRRPFPGPSGADTDPFLLLDHMLAAYEPQEAKGAPWHPHRGFETVTYLMDGTFVHHDSNGGGGVISDGDTQWMTAGSGILHDELPSEELVMKGGYFNGIQLWVNLPKAAKWAKPRYQDIKGGKLKLLSSADGGGLVRLIAGDLGEHSGPGVTYTPITLAHVSLSPGARLSVPWSPEFSAMAYVLSGDGFAGAENRPLGDAKLATFGPGDVVTITAGKQQNGRTGQYEVLLLGGAPLREPVARYGPFVMNTRSEIIQAVEDFQAGRMGSVPATHLGGEA